jgi:hypothetical protein
MRARTVAPWQSSVIRNMVVLQTQSTYLAIFDMGHDQLTEERPHISYRSTTKCHWKCGYICPASQFTSINKHFSQSDVVLALIYDYDVWKLPIASRFILHLSCKLQVFAYSALRAAPYGPGGAVRTIFIDVVSDISSTDVCKGMTAGVKWAQFVELRTVFRHFVWQLYDSCGDCLLNVQETKVCIFSHG